MALRPVRTLNDLGYETEAPLEMYPRGCRSCWMSFRDIPTVLCASPIVYDLIFAVIHAS